MGGVGRLCVGSFTLDFSNFLSLGSGLHSTSRQYQYLIAVAHGFFLFFFSNKDRPIEYVQKAFDDVKHTVLVTRPPCCSKSSLALRIVLNHEEVIYINGPVTVNWLLKAVSCFM